jgi:RimJ/RimL family protein N-acetyltransferase
VLRPTYPLRTERLLLRPVTEADFDDLFAFQSDPDVTRYVMYDARDREGMRTALAAKMRQTELFRDGDALSLAVTVPPDPTVIGELHFFLCSTAHRTGELGYVFHPAYQGRGYAREAAREILRVAFEEFRLRRVIARCDTRNTASWRLMEKLGMRREAHFVQNELFKGEWSDEFVYAMLDHEWAARDGGA